MPNEGRCRWKFSSSAVKSAVSVAIRTTLKKTATSIRCAAAQPLISVAKLTAVGTSHPIGTALLSDSPNFACANYIDKTCIDKKSASRSAVVESATLTRVDSTTPCPRRRRKTPPGARKFLTCRSPEDTKPSAHAVRHRTRIKFQALMPSPHALTTGHRSHCGHHHAHAAVAFQPAFEPEQAVNLAHRHRVDGVLLG